MFLRLSSFSFLQTRKCFAKLGFARLAMVLGVGLVLPFVAIAYAQSSADGVRELRVLVHNSFSIDKKLLARFEQQHQIKLSILKAGDTGAMLNRMILTKDAPLGDVVYGLDNLTAAKALAAGVIASNGLKGLALPTVLPELELGQGLAAIDYGVVVLNADNAELVQRGLPPLQRLEDLLQPVYKDTLVLENPATSSPGLAFLAASVEYFGTEKVWDFWRGLRANGVKVTEGWTQAYQKEFSQNGGAYPFVVSYNTSPAAEVFYSDGKYTQAPTSSLWLPGASWVQVEAAALVQGGKVPSLARAFILFLLSKAVQTDFQNRMWVMPARSDVALVPALQGVERPKPLRVQKDIDEATQRGWIAQWTRIMR